MKHIYTLAIAILCAACTKPDKSVEYTATGYNASVQYVDANEVWQSTALSTTYRVDSATVDTIVAGVDTTITIADTVAIEAITVFTGSGSTARRVARERPSVPMMVLTPSMRTARRVAILWGAHAVATKDIGSFEEMIAKGKRMALRHGFGRAGGKLIALAGVPFGTPGSTNLLHVVTITGDELDKHEG